MNESLLGLLNHGMIDEQQARQLVEMKEKYELLAKHPYRVWQGKNGKWYTYLDKPGGGKKLVKRNTENAVKDIVVAYWKEIEGTYTLEKAFLVWMEWKLEVCRLEQSTQTRYRNVFYKYYADWKERNIRHIAPIDFIDYMERCIGRYEMTAKEFSSLKTVTRGMLRRAKRNGLIGWSVEQMLADIEVSDKKFRKINREDYQEVYNDEEMQLVVNHLIQHQDERNLALLLLFMTGMRVGEVVTLQTDDVCDGYISVRRTEQHIKRPDGSYEFVVKESPKTEAGRRNVVIPPYADWLIRNIRKKNPFGKWLFVEDRNCKSKGERLNSKQIEYRLYRLCKDLSIYHKSPHKIRKTYISILLDSNADNKLITDQVGHVNISISERYYHRNRKSIEKKRSLLGEIQELDLNSYTGNISKPKITEFTGFISQN